MATATRNGTNEPMTELEQLRAEVAALQHRVEQLEHPVLLNQIVDADRRAAAQAVIKQQYAQRQAGLNRPAWEPHSGSPPPTRITDDELLNDPRWSERVRGEWPANVTQRELLKRCPVGSPLRQEAKELLLSWWGIEWDERELAAEKDAAQQEGRALLQADIDEQLAPELAAIAKERQSYLAGGRTPPERRIKTPAPRAEAYRKAEARTDALKPRADRLALTRREKLEDWEKFGAKLATLADQYELKRQADELDPSERGQARYMVAEADRTIARLIEAKPERSVVT